MWSFCYLKMHDWSACVTVRWDKKTSGFWDGWTMQRAYLSCLYRGLVSITPFFLKSSVSARSFRNSSPKITKSRVQSPCRFVYFFPLTSRFLESSARNLRRLGCGANVKLLDGLPTRPSQWNFLVENYCFWLKAFVRTERFSTSNSTVTMRAVS